MIRVSKVSHHAGEKGGEGKVGGERERVKREGCAGVECCVRRASCCKDD